MTLVPRPTASVYDANASVFQVGVPAPVTNLSLVRNVPGRTIDLSPPETVEESRSVTMAALRQENVIGSLLARQWESNNREEGYNAWSDIQGTAYEPYWDKFVESNNPGYTAALKRQVDMEEEDRRTLASAGGWGILASIGAGVFSPENLLPGGTVYRGVRAGQAALRTGISTATMAVVSTSLAEVALQDSQELRTPVESAFNIGGAAIIGGALGAGLSALFTKADYARLGKKFDAEVAEVMQTGGFLPEVAVKVNDEMTKRLVSVGRTAEDAGKEASLYGAFYQTMSKRTGKSVDELLVASPLPEVRGGMTGPDPDGVVYNQDGRIAIETPEFQRWFGESAVRAEDGKPLVVYHGSRSDIGPSFDTAKSVDGAFWFAGDTEVMDLYAGITGNVTPVYLSIKNPKIINNAAFDTAPQSFLDRLVRKAPGRGKALNADAKAKIFADARAEGHDGIYDPTMNVYVAFSPTQIKSVNNRGTFDPNDPRILFQSGKKASVADLANLFVAHNIKPNGLLNAARIGGLPMPSLAIARIDQGGFENFGEITLLANRDMVDPKIDKAAKVYNADAYSPRYPGVEYKYDDKAMRAFAAEAARASKDIGGRGEFDLSRLEDRGPAEAEYDDGVRVLFLRDTGRMPALGENRVDNSIAVDKAINEVRGEFSQWVEAKLRPMVQRERIFKGFDYNGNRRYREHTVENVYADMKSRLKEGEGFNYGVGNIRSRWAKVYKSIKQVQGDRDSIKPDADIEAVKKAFDDRFYALGEEMKPYYRFDAKGFGYFDDFGAVVAEFASKGPRALDDAFKDIPPEMVAKVREFGADLASAPTGYFEVKLNRIARLEEFSGALVPKGTQANVIDVLNKAGVRVIEYDKAMEGDRLRAVRELAAERDGILFQRDADAFPGDAPRASIEFGEGSSVIRLFGTADRSSFLHETGHFFLESYRMMAGASPDLKGDWDALSAYLEIGADGRVSVAAHEKFARSFEAYLLDGTAPSAALKGAFEQFRDWLVSIYKQIASLNVPINDDVRGIFDRMLATDAEIARARDPLLANEDAVLASIKQAASAGAAARPLETIDENTIAGKAAQVAGGAVRGLNPVLRVLHSSSAAVRSIGTRLFENPVYLKKNMQGVASDPSVETLVKEFTQGAMARAMKAANGIYKDYRKAGGQLGRVEFNEAVGKAMRRADEGDDPAISSAAASWRSAVFDPLKDMAIKAGLLPADVSVDTALSYFTRVYNRPMIEAREGEFKGIVRRYIDKSIRDLEFKADEIRIGNQIVDAGKANEKWRQAYDRLTSIDDRLAGRAAVRRRKVEDLNSLQQLRFVAQKDRPPAELVKRLRNADENASALGTLRDLRTAERSAGKKLKYHEKFPLLARVKQKGGVKVGSFLDFELRNMGVNPQSHPGLFKSEGGLGAVDNWPWDDDTFFMDNFGRMPDGYLDQNEVLAAIRQEVGGNPLRTPEMMAEDEALDALESNVTAWLNEVGLPSSVNVGEARAFIKRMTGAEKAVDELGLRIAKMERDLDTFDEGTESLANQRTISEAETAKLQEEMNALEEDILEMRQFANASPRVGIIIDYAKAKRDLFKAKLDASRLERRVDALKMVRDDGRMNDALALELAAKTTDLNRVLDRVDTLTKRADKLQPMVPKIRQELPDFVSDADRAEYVNQVVDDIFNTLTGRNADADIPREIVAATRGPLKERTFHIPDSEIEEFLESNVEAVARRYARTMAADIELTNAFGKADLKAQIEEIKSDYLRLRAAVANDVDPETDAPLAKPLTAAQKEKEVKRLVSAEKNDIRDIQALRDMVRGAYLARENSTNYARVARVAGTINYLRTMGGVTVSSMTDVARHVMVHGLTGVMRDGLLPMIANLKGFNMAVAEAQVAGAVTDRLLNTRMATWSDITDPYSVSSPFERFMENTANGFSKLNGMVYWNDFQKSFASVITQNRVLRGTMDYGNLDGRERAYLAFLGIDGSMAERIAKQFDAHGSTETGGVRVAHSDDWDDDWARRTYRAAINKDVDSTIITKGVGDIPLFMNTPTGRLLGQFKSFALASHQRALMRGLQERPMGFVSGTMLAATAGMMIYYLKSLEANRTEDVSDNPGRWIAEGLDRSGVFSIAFEANNTIEKAFGIGAYGALAAAFPDAEQSGKASRYSLRSTAAALTGPTGDLIDTAIRAGQAIKGSADGWTEGDVNSVKRLVPGATLPGIRSLVEYLGVPAVKGGLAIN